MRPALIAAIAALAVASAPACAKPRLSQEDQLAKALAGRTAGPPVDCIRQQDIDSSRIFDHTAILYEMRGGTYYLNRPTGGVESLNWDKILVTDTHTLQLCSIDVVKLYDRAARMQTGFLSLDKFVPYTKPR